MKTISAGLLLLLAAGCGGQSPTTPDPPVSACRVVHVPATTTTQIVYIGGVPRETLVVTPAHDETVCP